jgi:hypothetical protein
MEYYKLYLVQAGEGCDYTIACGHKMYDLSATTLDDAKKEAETLITEEFSHDERRLEEAVILEVTHIATLNLKELYADLHRANKEKENMLLESIERKKYEELKKKFESK